MSAEQQTLAEQAFDRIYGLMMSGELALGGVVNEAALSQRFGISRGPIREAVQRLQGLRLITREPYMRARVVSLSAHDLVDIFQLREAAEGMACRLAAQHMRDDEIARLADDLERYARPTRGRRRAPQGFDLHLRIARGCGNRRIEQLLCEDLHHLLRLYRRRSGDKPGRRDEAFDEHWQIVRALKARDADLAESLIRAHIGRATEVLLRAIESEAAAGAAGRVSGPGGAGRSTSGASATERSATERSAAERSATERSTSGERSTTGARASARSRSGRSPSDRRNAA